METKKTEIEQRFDKLVSRIGDIGREYHHSTLIKNAEYNLKFYDKTTKNLAGLSPEKAKSAIVISAGPSLHKFDILKKIKDSGYKGTTIAVDGSMVKCLKNGIIPDYVLTLDPHPTRIVRWFGDPNFEAHSEYDDYFSRQDLDVEFRNNSIRENNKNIELINEHGKDIKLIICSAAPKNVIQRAQEAKMDMYWWNPLVDNPREPDSLTRKIYNINKLPCFNTGGTVGTAAWVFATSVLGIKDVAVTGMDLGYHSDLPINMTQTYHELKEFSQDEEQLKSFFPEFTFPLTGEKFFTDPTYFWYRSNILDLLERSDANTYNCTGGGVLYGDDITCISLEDFLNNN